LLEGYEYSFVKNVATEPGSHHFKGIDNPGLVKEIKAWNADAVLVYGWAFKSHLKAMRHFHKKIPVFFRGDSNLLGNKKAFRKLLRMIILKWVYSKIDKALYVGTHNKDYFLQYGLNADQLVFVPHSIDNDRFSGNDQELLGAASLWRKKLNIDPAAIVFLFAAKLDDNKNALLLINSFVGIQHNNIHLIIAGNGEQEEYLHKTYCGFKNISFLPFQNQSNMPVLYRVGDVFVLPSKSETWGLSINEAMACHRAILASDQCGAAIDLVHNDINGFIFESGNVEDLKSKMQKCILDKIELKRKGEASYNLIQEWNYEHACKTIEDMMNHTNTL
jgi:glycosyltransferase involved in cell wall biosynthesis